MLRPHVRPHTDTNCVEQDDIYLWIPTIVDPTQEEEEGGLDSATVGTGGGGGTATGTAGPPGTAPSASEGGDQAAAAGVLQGPKIGLVGLPSLPSELGSDVVLPAGVTLEPTENSTTPLTKFVRDAKWDPKLVKVVEAEKPIIETDRSRLQEAERDLGLEEKTYPYRVPKEKRENIVISGPQRSGRTMLVWVGSVRLMGGGGGYPQRHRWNKLEHT